MSISLLIVSPCMIIRLLVLFLTFLQKMKLNSETDFNMNQAEDEAKAIELTL